MTAPITKNISLLALLCFFCSTLIPICAQDTANPIIPQEEVNFEIEDKGAPRDFTVFLESIDPLRGKPRSVGRGQEGERLCRQ